MEWEFILTFVVPIAALTVALILLIRAYRIDPQNIILRDTICGFAFLFLFFWFQTPSPLLEYIKKFFAPSIITHSISLYILFFADRIINGMFSKDHQTHSSKLWIYYLVFTQTIMFITYPWIDFSKTRVTVNAVIQGDKWAYFYLLAFITYTVLGVGRFVFWGGYYSPKFPENRRKLGIVLGTFGVGLIFIVGISVVMLLTLWAFTVNNFGQDFYGMVVRYSLAIAITLIGIGALLSTDLVDKIVSYFTGIILYIRLLGFLRIIRKAFPETKLYEINPFSDLLNFRGFENILYRFFIEISDARLRVLSHVDQEFANLTVLKIVQNKSSISLQDTVLIDSMLFKKGFENKKDGIQYKTRANIASLLNEMTVRQQLNFFADVFQHMHTTQ